MTDTPGSWATGSEMEQIEAVQSTLVSAFQIPEWDRDVVLDLYDANRGIVSTGRYTRIEIIGIAARSKDAKCALFKTIAENLKAVGVPRAETRISRIYPPANRWGIRVGKSPPRLDFKIDV